jgi:hypothetical protein
MVAGALGTWAVTPVLNVNGWAGLGFPIVIVAFALLVFQGVYIVSPNRAWLTVSLLLSALVLICAILLSILVGLLSHAGHLLAIVLTRGDHRDAFGVGRTISLGWGVYLMGVGALGLFLGSAVGMFVHGNRPIRIPGASHVHTRALGVGEDGAPSTASADFEAEWLDP